MLDSNVQEAADIVTIILLFNEGGFFFLFVCVCCCFLLQAQQLLNQPGCLAHGKYSVNSSYYFKI